MLKINLISGGTVYDDTIDSPLDIEVRSGFIVVKNTGKVKLYSPHYIISIESYTMPKATEW